VSTTHELSIRQQNTNAVPATIIVTKTSTKEITKTVPYQTKSYQTICYTKPVEVWTSSTTCIEQTVPYQVTQTSQEVDTKTTEVPKYITTQSPCPEVITSTQYSSYTSLCTKSVGSKCETSSVCQTKTAGGYGWN